VELLNSLCSQAVLPGDQMMVRGKIKIGGWPCLLRHSRDAEIVQGSVSHVEGAVVSDGRAYVVVVGAGPTGLYLAGDLAEAGVAVTVLERRSDKTSNLARAFAVHARTMESFDMRGLIDELLSDAVCRVRQITWFDAATGDFSRLATRYNWMTVTPQYNVERILLDRARRLGVTIRYDTEVVDLRQDATGVEVDARSSDGNRSTYHAEYVVGCDGNRSAVRTLVDIPWDGQELLTSMILADVRFAEPPPGELAIWVRARTDRGFAVLVPYDDENWWRIVAWHRDHATTDVTPDLTTLADVVREAHGTDYGMYDPRWLSVYDADERQARTYRAGRVFVAGDAGHMHSPAGGQGMNVGLQDAENLAVKLIAVRRGAPESILESYESERYPVGQRVIQATGNLVRAAIGQPEERSAIRAEMQRPSVGDRIAEQLSGLPVRYPAPPGAHPAVGAKAEDVPLVKGTRLYEALRDRRHVLLMPTDADEAPPLDGWHDRVQVVTRADAVSETEPSVLLIRPDGYVAGAWHTADAAHLAAVLPPVLTEQCGPRTHEHDTVTG
jgi:2-polyprenyl-6-methoxyphenol hydroxylase-like FAD-dependent oxidoreductase